MNVLLRGVIQCTGRSVFREQKERKKERKKERERERKKTTTTNHQQQRSSAFVDDFPLHGFLKAGEYHNFLYTGKSIQ